MGSGVVLEAETPTVPRGGTDAGRLGGIGAAMCWRCGVVSRNEVCVFFHREINNSTGMSGLPASGKGWFWQARAYLQPSCQGTGLVRSQHVGAGDVPGCGSLLCRWPSHMGRRWEPSWPCLCSAPGQSLPSLWGAFPASPSMGLPKGVALSKPGHAGPSLHPASLHPCSAWEQEGWGQGDRAGFAAERSPWALGSTQGQKSTPQTHCNIRHP